MRRQVDSVIDHLPNPRDLAADPAMPLRTHPILFKELTIKGAQQHVKDIQRAVRHGPARKG